MAEKIKKNDFIELDYTGKLTDGLVFDTTIKEVAEKNNLHSKESKYSPIIVCIGERQVLPGLDDELIGKEVGKTYTFTLPPERAFGKRDVKKVKMMPLETFRKHEMKPQPGMQIDADGEIGTVMQVSGGRVMVNFNHLLAGKEVVYEVQVKREIADAKEKLGSFLKNTFQLPAEKIKIELKEEKAEVNLPLNLPAPLVEILTKKLAEVTGLKEVTFTPTEKKDEKKKHKEEPVQPV